MEHKNIWVIVEKHEGKPLNVSLELLGKGRILADEKGEKLVAVLIGYQNADITKTLIEYGADEVINVDAKEYGHYRSDSFTFVLNSLIDKYHPFGIMIGATSNGKDLGGRISARRRLGLVAGCTDVYFNEDKSELLWERATFDGKLFSTIITSTFPKIGTVGNKTFRGNTPDSSRTGVVIDEKIEMPEEDIRTKVLEIIQEAQKATIGPDMETADIIVAGGKGVGSKDKFAIIEEFAAAVNGAVACTKPLVDAGWMHYDYQVGSTGKKVSPKIYFAFGISGQLQHTEGMKDSDLIIAVNNDPNAPIFQVAHYGIVGDLFKVIPVLKEEFLKLKQI